METSNVVRLPVDWLGPREDLVPVGPRADAAAADADEPAADPPLRAASDFWGEDSAAVQDAWQPLPAPAQVGAPEPARERAVRTAGPRGRARAPRPPMWLAIAAVIIAIVAVALGHGGSGASPPHANVAGVTTAGHVVASGSDRATLGFGSYGASFDRRVRTNGHRRLGPQHKPSRAHAANGVTRAAKNSVTESPASTSGGARTAVSTDATPAPAPQSVDSTPTAESQPTRLTSSQGSTAGPTGNGAPFGPGHLS
jgi:hypothetical protein